MPVVFTVEPITAIARHLLNRNRLAGDHRFVDRAYTFDYNPVNRDFFSGTNTQMVTHAHVIQRNVLFISIRIDSAGRFWR